MRLLKQVRLFFQEGSSDKVYEIDLCEIGPGRCVVNYRFGRRGSRLREGSHTAAPVSLAEAERAFTTLEQSKRRKGYLDLPAAGWQPARRQQHLAGRLARLQQRRPGAPVAPQPSFARAAVLRRLQAGPRGASGRSSVPSGEPVSCGFAGPRRC